MLALTLDDAKNIALVAAVAFAAIAIISFWILKSLVQKLLVAGLLGLLAFAFWSQRSSLQDCADKVIANYEREGTDVTVTDTDCSFFGVTITISDPRTGPTDGSSTDSTDSG